MPDVPCHVTGRHYEDAEEGKPSYYAALDVIRRGDIVGVIGTPSKTSACLVLTRYSPLEVW